MDRRLRRDSRHITMDYHLKTQAEAGLGLPLQIQSLANLDQTIDALFDELARTGNEALLEDLCPYFGTVWPSARALASQVAALPEAELKGSTFLELGCGLALPSLVAASRGARVLATDFHPEVEKFLLGNLEANALTGKLSYRRLDWHHPDPQAGAESLGRHAWVVASDVLYESKHPPLVAAAVERTLAPGGTALITDPGRPYLQAFESQLKERGFQVRTEIVNASDDAGGPATREIFLLRAQKTIF